MSEKTVAAVLHRPGPIDRSPLRLEEIVLAPLADDEVRIEVAACAVCRTDLQLCEGDLTPRTLPVVPGHQVVGTITAVGSAVGSLSLGDRVGVAWIAGTCGTCRFCRSGRENLCDTSTFTGWDRNGGFALAMTARADFTHLLPDGFDAIAAAPLLCGGAIGLRSLRVSGIEPGGRLGLYGFGASATCAIQIARHWGCEVYVCTRSADEQTRALELGAVWAGGYDQKPPQPLDAAVTFAPAGSVVVAALRALDKGGVVAVNAIHLDHIPEFDYDDLWWERQIRSVSNVTRSDVAELIDLAARLPIRTRTEAFALDEVNQALIRLSHGGISGAAVLEMAVELAGRN